MVQGKKQLNSKPKFAVVVIGDNEANEMRESANVRNHRNPYFKLRYPNGVTLISWSSNVRAIDLRHGDGQKVLFILSRLGCLQASSDDVLIVWSLQGAG